jgi:ATP phosphoribosyltransferase regulatory subunit
MRDLLPEEARARRLLAGRALAHFESHGYLAVVPPVFELAEVLARGLGTLGPAEMIRFVEPDSGEVAALRPDMTPQIARMVATRLADRPLPIRLCYEGTIVRRRRGGARRHRQVPQSGVELYGVPGAAGDLEMLALAVSSARALGLTRFVLDVGHAGIARALLEGAPSALADALSDALAHKDAARVEDLLHGDQACFASEDARALRELPHLSGSGAVPAATELLARAERALAGSRAEPALRELAALWRAITSAGEAAIGDALHLDLGEVRGLAYYTGIVFQLLAEGPGEPIGSGGRYDGLLERFGVPMPAIGFALQLDAVAWARRGAGIVDAGPQRLLVAGDAAANLASALRAIGLQAAVVTDDDLAGYARAWGFTHIVRADTTGCVVVAIDATPPDGDAAAPRPQAAAKVGFTRVDGDQAGEVARRVLDVVRGSQP